MNDTFMKERPVFPLLLSMALPMAISMLVNSLYNIVDAYYVAEISDDAMTALSLVFPVQNLINAVAIGFGIGLNAVVSRRLGEGAVRRGSAVASWGVALSLLHGVLMAALCLVLMPSFLGMFTPGESVQALALRYARIVFLFAPVMSAAMAYEKIFQAMGRMKATMLCMLLGCVTNILLDPVMIFGCGPFPAMGIDGAAAATVIGQTLPVIAYLLICRRVPMSVEVGLKYLSERSDVGRLYAVGIPATLNLALPSLLISALNAILGAFGQGYVLVLGAYYKLQTFLYLTANGIVQGMRPIIGYNRGAGEFGRVREIYRTALWMSGAIMAAGTVICLLIPEQLMGPFSSSAETVAAGGAALRIICAGFLLSSVSVTSCGALEGLGQGAPSLLISLCRYALVILPAAYLLSRSLGAAGVWHAFWVTEAVTAVVAFAVYRWQVRLCMSEQGVQGVQGEPDTAAG